MKTAILLKFLILALFLPTLVQAKVLFEDDFNSGTMSTEWISLECCQYVQNQMLFIQDTDGWPRDALATVHDGDEAWTDYTVYVKADFDGGLVDHFNILLRTNGFYRSSGGNAGTGYQLEFIGTGGWLYEYERNKIVLTRYEHDGVGLVKLYEEPWNPPAGLKNIKISLNGNRIELWVNDEPIFDVVDSQPLLFGGMGLHTVWEARAKFDDILVVSEDSMEYIDLTSLPDINDNGTPELAALRMLADGTPEIIIKDSETKELISTLTIAPSDDRPIGVAPVLDINGNGYPELAVLFVQPNGRGRVVIKDSMTDEWINQMKFFSGEWTAKAINSQDSDGDGVSEVSVLAERDDGTQAAISLKDSISDETIKWIGLPVE